MPEKDGADLTTTIERAHRLGKRLAHAAVIGIAAAFIGASSWQITSAVFGLRADPVARNWRTASPTDRACALGVQTLAAALNRAGSSSAWATTPRRGDAATDFRHALSPEWERVEDVSLACAASRQGLDAWAALKRLEIAEETLPRSSSSALEPLRRDLATHLPPDLR